MKFKELNLDKKLLQGIEEAGFEKCFDVQEESIPRVLEKCDVMVQSQTGSGKTAAFLIPIFQLLTEWNGVKDKKAMIIVPTRELAVQIEKEAKIIGKYLPFKVGSFYGGVSYAKQEKLLKEGVDIIVGTPGRLIDFGDQNKLNYKEIGITVIDEADRLFDMGFMPDLRKMLKKMPQKSERLTLLFSATLSQRVRNLAWEYMNNAVEIELTPQQITVDTIKQELYHISKNEKMKLLLGILKHEKPANGIIFTNTKSCGYEVAKRLEFNGYRCEFLMGDLNQKKRLKIIDSVKSGKVPFLVATDVASRGLHIDDLELVVNYDLPEDYENYVHRIGRTARVGKSGKAITFACENYVYGLEALESYINMKIPVVWAEDDLFAEDSSEGMTFSISREKRHRPGTKKRSKTVKSTKRPALKERKKYKSAGSLKLEKVNKGSGIKEYGKTKTRKNRRPGSNKYSDRSNVKKGSKKKVFIGTEEKKISRNSLEDRLEYYRKKYGENFQASDELIRQEKMRRKKFSLKKIFRLFNRKSR